MKGFNIMHIGKHIYGLSEYTYMIILTTYGNFIYFIFSYLSLNNLKNFWFNSSP